MLNSTFIQLTASSFVYTGEAGENVPGCTDLHHL